MRKLKIPAVMLLLWLLPACAAPPAAPAPLPAVQATPAALELTSPAFKQGDSIPQQYTCQGAGKSFELDWSAPPAGAQSLALIMSDPDAPGRTFIHWVVYNLPSQTRSLPEASSGKLPGGAVEGKTSANSNGYVGPCPPSGTHHYTLRLYALDVPIQDKSLDAAGLEQAMAGHILARGELMGVYAKK